MAHSLKGNTLAVIDSSYEPVYMCTFVDGENPTG